MSSRSQRYSKLASPSTSRIWVRRLSDAHTFRSLGKSSGFRAAMVVSMLCRASRLSRAESEATPSKVSSLLWAMLNDLSPRPSKNSIVEMLFSEKSSTRSSLFSRSPCPISVMKLPRKLSSRKYACADQSPTCPIML